jgi:protein O-GlcNAc transferase
MEAQMAEVLAQAWNYLQRGSFAQAENLYRQVLQADAANINAHSGLAIALSQLGKLEEAASSLQGALSLQPNHPEIHNNLGAIFARLRRTADAIDSYRRALDLKPDYPQAHYNLGVILKATGQRDEAIAELEKALRGQPEFPQALHDLGDVLVEKGEYAEAESRYRQALRRCPERAETHHNLGCVIQRQRRLEESLTHIHQAIRLNPKMAEAHFSLGNALFGQGPSEEAVLSFRRAIALKPNFALAHNSLGQALAALGRIDEAVASFRRALEAAPDSAEIYSTLGGALKAQGKFEEVTECYRRALELKPNSWSALAELVSHLQHLCIWENLEKLSQQLIDGVQSGSESDAAPPFVFLTLPCPTTAQLQFQCARQFTKQYFRPMAYREYQPAVARPHSASSRIVIGYLSGEFREHTIGYLITELIERHDRDKFAIFGYSYGPNDGGPTRRRLATAFDRFADLKDASFLQAARRIQADGVNVLVDLKGYCQNARPQIMALRPAPIQVNYVGYPGTMAAEFIDYILVDDFIVPANQQPFFAEKLVHLPGCYLVNDTGRKIAAPCPSREDCGLPETGFVYCSFSGSYKITPQIFEVWMRLLKAVPGSVLWLIQDNSHASVNLRREAESRGVAPHRLVFAPVCPLPVYLARHQLADLFLDTFPYNAHTSACDALWAGCPVLTLTGDTFPARVAGSLLRNLGLTELITTTLQEYEDMALRLATNADLLAALRTTLQANRKTATLFDGTRFARHLEQAFATMWQVFAAGQEPRSFAVKD